MDYTSREYTALRNDLMALIPNFAPQWTSRDSSDFGIVLIELFSYLGDLLNYQIDRAANESFIDTATQRDTVIKLASLLGYIPNSGAAATGSVTFTNPNATVTIPKGATLTTSGDNANPSITFTLDADTVVNTNSTATGNVTQGSIVDAEALGNSNGISNQTFQLVHTGVFIDSKLSVSVGGVAYTRFDYLIDAGATDLAFNAYTDANGNTFIKFGDGVSGKIPPSGSAITATYRYTTTAPSLGNIAAGTLTTIGYTTSVSVTNPKTFSGGADAESTDSIRTNAPKALRSLNRAVSLDDYADLALLVNGVAKATAISNSYASVSLYLAGTGGGTLSSSLKSNVITKFNGKTPPGTTITLNDYSPVYPYLNITLQVYPQYNANDVVTAVQAALYNLFYFDNVSFNDFIAEGEIYSTCKSVDGVSYVTINDYEKVSANPNPTTSPYGIYTQSGTVAAGTTSSTSVTLTAPTMFRGSKIISVSGSTSHAAVTNGTYITSVSTDGLTIGLSAATTFATGAVIVTQGNNGLTPGSRDFSCAINEIPIYEPTYITVTANGGS
jgi:hypothetical protein